MQEALLLHRQGALADAALRYSQVMRREPRNVDAVFLLALIMTQQGQVAEAQKLLRKAVKLTRARSQSAWRHAEGERTARRSTAQFQTRAHLQAGPV
jgi:thioredoxin-like negative regulator of GroEL